MLWAIEIRVEYLDQFPKESTHSGVEGALERSVAASRRLMWSLRRGATENEQLHGRLGVAYDL